MENNCLTGENKSGHEGYRKFFGSLTFTGDEETNLFLEEKSLELSAIQAKTSLELGRVFSEVHSRLASHHKGCYETWLEANGFTRMTALRHRRRYELFLMSSSLEGKAVIASLPYSLIAGIYKHLEAERAVSAIDSGATREELEALICSFELSLDNEPKTLQADSHSRYKEVIEILNRVSPEKIPSEKKLVFRKDLDRISKMLSKWI